MALTECRFARYADTPLLPAHAHARQQIPFGTNNPVQIAHEPESHTFGIGCVRSNPIPLHDSVPTPSTHSEVVSSFQVLDDASFEGQCLIAIGNLSIC